MHDPTQALRTSSGRLSLPVIICIVLGALLCLLLALLVGHVRGARAERRGFDRAWEPFSEAVYEEIGYSPVWEKQAGFSGSGSHSEGSLPELQPHPRDSKEEEDGPGSAPGDLADSYDDAREIPDPGQDPESGQGDWETAREPEEGPEPRDAPGGAKLHSQSSAGAPGAEGDAWCLSPESTNYDDAEEMSLAHPLEDTKTGPQELSAEQFPSHGPGEPIPAIGLGSGRREERTVQLGEL
ncbi:antigen WC1.1-like [Cuculus canorus]|uniref:antigen WC1.1-like n=1 Tax=Cuculus canorus TaxID=55661 RepID=UPI0023AAEB80|nr:antigen WC1.1-like [Cuculus canorus]